VPLAFKNQKLLPVLAHIKTDPPPNPDERELAIRFEERDVLYDFNELDQLSLAYAITIHKSQGSEFPAVVVPLAMQHYLLLQRNLVYTAMTRGRRLVVLVGQRKALAIALAGLRKPWCALLCRCLGLASGPFWISSAVLIAWGGRSLPGD
jgi:hypothetical protein